MFFHQEIFYLHMFYLHLIISFVALLKILLVLFDQVYLNFYFHIFLLILFVILDFLPAVNNMVPLTPNNNSPITAPHSRTSSTNNIDEMTNNQVTTLHQRYRKLVEKNHEYIFNFIKR